LIQKFKVSICWISLTMHDVEVLPIREKFTPLYLRDIIFLKTSNSIIHQKQNQEKRKLLSILTMQFLTIANDTEMDQ
jgi:hypothetical protein